MRHLISIFIILSSLKAFGYDYHVDTIDVHSYILNENRRIYYYTPNDIISTDSVIFLYLLDGEYSGYRYKKLQNEFPNKQIIGVGILNTNRRRDMLPVEQPGIFLEFIEKELIPEVESNYQVKRRIIFGHSLAGGFVINSMIQSPGLFDKYIASSPTPIMDFVDSDIYMKLDIDLNKNILFYFSNGSKDMRQVRKWTLRLNESLTGIEFDRIDWKNDVYKGKKHNNCELTSLIKGLKY
ncbi:alpha/beta hydrolase [Bacteroidota bacterium]